MYLFYYFLVLSNFICYISGHGVLIQPIAMSAKLVFGNDTTGVKDYDSMSLNCGGVSKSGWDLNCGICGDSIDGPLNHEPNGIYYDDRIVESYDSGQIIEMIFKITTNHLGNIWFDLCNLDINNFDESCFDTLLYQLNGKSNYSINNLGAGYTGNVFMKYILPKEYRSSNTIIRLNWLSNNQGKDNNCNSVSPNEYYRNCAFVSIF